MNALSALHRNEISREEFLNYASLGYVTEETCKTYNYLVEKVQSDPSKMPILESFIEFLDEDSTLTYSDLAQYAICECVKGQYFPVELAEQLQEKKALSSSSYQFIQENICMFSEEQLMKLQGIYYGIGLTEAEIRQMPVLKETMGTTALSESETPISKLLNL